MKYRIVKRGNPLVPGSPKKQYASAVNAGVLTVKDFSNQVSGRSSLTRGDVENVLINFLDEIPVFLKTGMSVRLGEFGTLRLTVASKGVDEDQVFTGASIKGVRVIFTPSPDFKRSLENITFERLHE
jgi:predicted histone-like DNA-binding protein